MFGELIEGGFGIIGGQLSAAQNRQAMRMSADLQREFAQNGIQWRVEDAKRAGIHPLAALGMMPASATPMVIGDVTGESFQRAGQNIGRAIDAGSSRDDRDMAELNKRLILSQIEESDARRLAIMSDIGLKHQAAGQGASIGVMPESALGTVIEGQAPVVPGVGVVDVKPSPVLTSTTGDTSIQAGFSPNLEKVMVHPKLPMLMPAARGQESTWEIWAELPAYEKWGIIMRNVGHYGRGWLKDFFRVQYLGEEPEKNWSGVKGAYPEGKTDTLIVPGVMDDIRRQIEKFKDIPRRYKKATEKDKPGGR